MRSSKVAFGFGFGWLAFAGLACSSSSDSASGVIGPDGGQLSSTDGILTVSLRPGALTEDIELTIEEDTTSPTTGTAGPRYRVRPDIALGVGARITYASTFVQSVDAAVGRIRLSDFQAGNGRWLALESSVDTTTGVAAATDAELSMFYGLLTAEGRGDDVAHGDESGETASAGGESTQGQEEEAGDEAQSTMGLDDGAEGGDAADEAEGGDESEEETGSSEQGEETGNDTGASADCDNLYIGDYPVTDLGLALPGGTTEDLAMTGNGSFVVMDGDNFLEVNDAYATSFYAVAEPAPNALGIRFHTNGNIVFGFAAGDGIFEAANGMIVPFGPEDEIPTPNGVHVDFTGAVWVTNFQGGGNGRVMRINPDRTMDTVVTGLNNPNGVYFDEDRSVLFFTTYQASEVYRAEVSADGDVGVPTLLTPPGGLGGNSDGMTMDVCGHIYVVDNSNPARVVRVFLDSEGQVDPSWGTDGFEEVAGGAAGTDIGNGKSNAQFGVGYGDERDQGLFVVGPSGSVFTVNLQVEGKRLPGE